MKYNLFIFTPCFPHYSHPGHWDGTKESLCWLPGSRPLQARGHFTLVPLPFGTTSHYLFAQPPQLQSSGNDSKHISLTWPFPHRHQHVQWPVDVVELLYWFLLLNTDSAVAPLSMAMPGYWLRQKCINNQYVFSATEIWLVDLHWVVTHIPTNTIYIVLATQTCHSLFTRVKVTGN